MDSHFYNDYSLPSELCGYATPAMSSTMWGSTSFSSEENNNLVPILCDNNNGAASFDVVSPESDISSCTMRAPAATLPELPGFPEDIVTYSSEHNHFGLNAISGLNFGGGDSYIQLYNKVNNMYHQFGGQEGSDGYMPANSNPPLGLAVQENWGFDQGNKVPTMEDQSSNMKVGRYSEEERKERIERYLKKRNQRNFNKTIKYACRKTLADRRVRVRGRFARNEHKTSDDSSHQEMAPKNIDTDCDYHASFVDNCEENVYCSGGNVQIKYDEEEWLQEAITSLVYLPYATAG